LVLSIITSRAALSAPVRTTSSRNRPSPTLIWLAPDPPTRSTSFCTTAASPTRAGGCACARGDASATDKPNTNARVTQ
jgi:hypothetical protein